MAKDGTARGGVRIGSGPKPKALTDKVSRGKAAKVIELPDVPTLVGADMPPVKEYMKSEQKDGGEFLAEDIYKDTWEWLQKMGCAEIVNVQLIQQYAMNVARQIQCEEMLSRYGFLAKHPTTGAPIASPYASLLNQFTKQANQSWFQIYQIVKENSTADYQTGNPQSNTMELLLRKRNGG